MEKLFFTSIRCKVQGKQGILTPESDGSYIMPIGAFNCVNSAGEFYTKDNIADLFKSSSELMRKVENGKLFGEWGHPEMQSGESANDFMNRACRINDKDTCVFFKDIWIEDKVTPVMQKYGVPSDALITMARLKPMGAKWEALDRSLKDPDVNTTFSGRFLTRDRIYRGKTYVVVEQIVTWDAVTEQGIPAAEKYLSPRLESRKTMITPAMVENMKTQVSSGKLRMENNSPILNVISTAEKFFAQTSSKKNHTLW